MLAKVAEKEGNLGDALRYAKAAYEFAPTDLAIAVNCLRLFSDAANYRSALELHRGLPASMASKDPVRRQLSRTYRLVGWPAMSRAVHDDTRHPSLSFVNRVKSLWWRLVDRLLIKFETVQQTRLWDWEPTAANLERIHFRSPTDAYQALAEVDKMVISDIRMRQRYQLLHLIFTGLWGLGCIGATLAIFISHDFGHLPVLIAIAAGSTIAMGAAGTLGLTWDRNIRRLDSPTFPAVVRSTSAAWIGVSSVGLILSMAPTDNRWVSIVAAGVLTGAGLFTIWVFAAWCKSIYNALRYRQHKRTHAKAWAIDSLADLVNRVNNVQLRGTTSERHGCLEALEDTAALIEQHILKQLPMYDNSSSEWFAHRLAGVAESVRHMERLVLSPTSNSWDHLSRMLTQQLTAAANSNWCAALYRKPIHAPPPKRRDRLIGIARVIFISTIPLLGTLALVPVFGVETLRWVIIGTVGWAVLSLLFAIDPSFREKIEVARGVASSSGELFELRKSPEGDHRQ